MAVFNWIGAQGPHLDYDITFAGTVGVLEFHDHLGDGDDGFNAGGGGVVKITDPTPGEIDPATNTCTSDFGVTGAVAGVLPHHIGNH
jgi:hypothetical protein